MIYNYHGCCFMHARSNDWSGRCIHDDRVRKSLPLAETLVLLPLVAILVYCWRFDNLCFLKYMGASFRSGKKTYCIHIQDDMIRI